jgi:hypothetical protein
MGRSHLLELHDLPWFPVVWRDLLTDYLSFYAATLRPYRRVAPIVAGALERAGTNRIVDLCSGAGRPVLSLMSEIRGCGLSRLEVVLTDKYPNLAAWRDIQTSEGDSVSFEATPVDAVDVPRRLAGFRTLFTSFHHFAPDSARLVLSDAVNSGQGIGIFEYTERSWWIWGIPILLIPLFVWISTPFIRPFSWRRLLWTYLLPVVPVVALWDGFVSCLRSYSVEELRGLVEGKGNGVYRWEIGRVPSRGLSRVTYLVGLPLLTVGTRRHQEPGVAENVEGEGS